MKKLVFAVVLVAVLNTAAAFADTFQLNCLPAATCGPTSWGTVSVVQSLTPNQVDVTVTLNDAFFVRTGSHETFLFNLSSAPTVVGLSDAYSATNFTYLGSGSFSQSAFGQFGFAYNCIQGAADGCGPGASVNTVGPLKFYVQGLGITPASFVPNSKDYYFSADLYYQTATGGFITGPVGSTFRDQGQVPEPASLILVGSGLIGLGCVIRARRR